MTTLTVSTATADFAKLKNTASQSACFTTPDFAKLSQVPIGTGSPLFKLAVLISRCFGRLLGPATLVPDRVEEANDDYPMAWPCCS